MIEPQAWPGGGGWRRPAAAMALAFRAPACINMHAMYSAIIFGAAGYAGLELVKLLAAHPGVRIAGAASDARAGTPVDDMTGTQTGAAFVATKAALAAAGEGAADVALLATPPEASRELAPQLLARGLRVVDLSNAFRGDASAVYGLASLFAGEVAAARLVANPGCYATAVITALAPLVRHGLVEPAIAVAAGSGVTGAGRTADEAMSLGEMYGEVRAYKVLRHQHVPEIERTLARLASEPAARPRVALTTHLLPVARGIFATVTARLRTAVSTEALAERYRADFAGDGSVVVAASAEHVSLRRVVGSNVCAVGVASEGAAGGFVIVTAALDNLIKGAAGQAVENMNLMLGLPRMAGLAHLARHA
jgi:N-acetyl-gamma-glutamyl-phosphate reductase